MSFWTYLPLMKTGLAIMGCTSKQLAEIKREKGVVTFWDILGCVGVCALQFGDKIEPPQKSKVKKKTSKVALKQ